MMSLQARLHTWAASPALTIALHLCVAILVSTVIVSPRISFAEEQEEQQPVETQNIPSPEDQDVPFVGEADAVALLDKAGNVIYELNGTKQEHPASTTKVMTAMVALDSKHDLNEIVEIQAPDLGDNSQMGDYSTGDRIPLGELMRVMLVYSANDAAWNVAKYVAGSESAFVDLMNKKAKELGLEHTHFVNSHGLEDDNHYTCAIDLAKIGRYALEHYPFIAQTAIMPTVTTTVYGEEITLNSTDRLLETFDGIRGIKTGAIVANYTFLGASGRGNVQLYTAVLGCQSFMGRFDDAASVMEWGYAHYGQRQLTHKGWLIRANPYAYNLGFKAPVRSASDCNVSIWSSLGGLSYSTVQARPNRLLNSSADCGWTNWRQKEASVGSVTYTTEDVPQHMSAWPVFSQPLFTNESA